MIQGGYTFLLLLNDRISTMPRSRLGPLAIETKLGDHPATSSVWRSIHVQQKKSAAVKLFSQPFGGTPESRQALSDEWEQLKGLQHSALARCYGGGFEGTDAYLVYELVEGETLASQIERRGRLPWETVLEYAEPLVDALDYLHSKGIKHGRITPDKIIIAGLSPVLLDVRIDRQGAYQSNRPPTATELALQAPELLESPDAISVRSDLYNLGATLYLALTGEAPISGTTIEEVTGNLKFQTPVAAASTVLDCPVWFDKLISQLLSKDPASRPVGAGAVKLALAEVRKRSMSRTGVAEHASAGFSALAVTDQKDRDEARVLLGRELVDLDEDNYTEQSAWYEKTAFLVVGLCLIVGLIAYFAWPLNEDGMRERAEALMAKETRTALAQAKISYLRPMTEKFPDGQHTAWAYEQIDHVEMVEAEHALTVKMKRGLPLTNESERLFAEALDYERFGDQATALKKYHGMVTLLSDEDEYRPLVNLARNKIARIETGSVDPSESASLIRNQLATAKKRAAEGNVAAAITIWNSIVNLYGNNANVAPLVAEAQNELQEHRLTPPSEP